MSLTQWDHEIQAFAPHCSDQPFAVGIRLRCPRRRPQHAQTKGLDLIIHFCREDGVAIAYDKAIDMIGWNCVSKLLQGPFCRWVRGEIALQDGTRPVGLRRGVFSCFCGLQRRAGKRAKCQHRRQMRAEMEFLRTTTGIFGKCDWGWRTVQPIRLLKP